MSEEKSPIIGITTGDVNGIGPEVIMNTLSDKRILQLLTPVIYGYTKVFSFYRKVLKIQDFHYNQINSVEEALPNKVNIINCNKEDMEVTIGQPDIVASRLAFSSLEAAMKDLLDSKINAMVTAPINKHALRELKEFDYAGHTEYVTKSAGSPESLMMMCTEKLKVGVATGHIPLAQVPAAISKDMIERKVAILEKSLKKDFGIQKPKIAILGLNPHAGENGVLGKEELDHIIPAIEEIKSKGTLAFGPFASDGFFGTFAFKKYDGILAMYHDQGLIPFKTLAFEEGVNYTAGLPVIRTSPDHGTAYDIAGKDIADTTSFREAMYMAKAIAMNRVDN